MLLLQGIQVSVSQIFFDCDAKCLEDENTLDEIPRSESESITIFVTFCDEVVCSSIELEYQFDSVYVTFVIKCTKNGKIYLIYQFFDILK